MRTTDVAKNAASLKSILTLALTRDDPDSRRMPWSGSDWLGAAALGAGGALVCVAAVIRRPDLNAGMSFVFADAGVNLLMAEKLHEGARLYRDLGFSYGPLAIYPYEWFTRLFGNSPQSFSAFLALFSIVNVVLSYCLLRRHVSRRVAVFVVVLGLYSTLLLPGSLIFGVQSSAYFVLERTLFLLVCLTWRAPANRELRHSVAIGLLLGVWQGLRFGTALFLGAAIVIVDVLALYFESADRATVIRWIRLSLVTLGCFLAIEGAWIVWAYSLLPAPDARDFLWPSYVLEAFEVWPAERRFPRFESIPLLVGQQLLPVGCAGLGIVVVWRALRALLSRASGEGSEGRWRLALDDLALLVPFAFYAIGAAGLFRSVYHFHQYAWTLSLTAALAIARGGRRVSAGFLLVSAPALMLMLRANLLTDPPADAVIIRPPLGGHLMVSPAERGRLETLRRFATEPVPRSLIIMTDGGGFHALFGTRFSGRQSFYIVGFARGDDAQAMLRTLESGVAAIVLTNYPVGMVPAADPCQWYGWRHFATEFCPRLAQRVDTGRVIQVDEVTWIVPSAAAVGSKDAGVAATPMVRAPVSPVTSALAAPF